MRKFRRRAYVKSLRTTVKRPAEENEKIIVVKPSYTGIHKNYKIGDVFVVKHMFSESIHTTEGIALWDSEYRVLV